ncbi:MAG: hypothetical protein LH624_07205, partial [Cryobacterium sp.]|nr:hypothetical protein [Cryobacterium sp.]
REAAMTTTATKPTAAAKSTPKATPAKLAPKAVPAKATAPKEQPTKPKPTTLVEALSTGQATLIKVRGNKTQRSLPYLAVGTQQRSQAEAVAKMKEGGQTVEAIAEALTLSTATARRFITNLALPHAVDSGDHDKGCDPGTREVVVHTVMAKQSKA